MKLDFLFFTRLIGVTCRQAVLAKKRDLKADWNLKFVFGGRGMSARSQSASAGRCSDAPFEKLQF